MATRKARGTAPHAKRAAQRSLGSANEVDEIRSEGQPQLYEFPSGTPAVVRVPEGYQLGKAEVAIIFTALVSPRLREDTKKKADYLAQCCKDHPEDPTVKITNIRLTNDFSQIEVTVEASHPCGIRRVHVFVADRKIEESDDEFKVPLIVYVARLVNGAFIENKFEAECKKEVKTTLPLPTRGIIGTSFYIVASATNCCDVKAFVPSSKRGIF